MSDDASADVPPPGTDPAQPEPEGTTADDAQPQVAPAEPTEEEQRARALIARFEAELGDAVIESGTTFGDAVVRVKRDAWRRTAEVARNVLGCRYLSFISGIDWMPAPRAEGDDAGGDTSSPVQPTDTTFGIAGSAGRFQLFAAVQSVDEPFNLIVKTDLDEHDPRVDSWVPVYAGADWHERECNEMFGVTFDGHPAMRHLYLPSQFEGYPLRKDFPLLAREVKPWPGLVDVEPMPGEEPGAEEEG